MAELERPAANQQDDGSNNHKSDNKRRGNMPTTTSPDTQTATRVDPVQSGMHTVTPHLVCAGAADAIEFYKYAFNAVEMIRLPGPDGKIMHACIRIGDSAVMLVDESLKWDALGPNSLKGSPVTIHLSVADADAVV